MKTAEAARADGPIDIDGRLDEEAWNGATVITDLHQILPVEFSEPTQRTEFLVLYDDEALYLAARMYDDQPDRVVAAILILTLRAIVGCGLGGDRVEAGLTA